MARRFLLQTDYGEVVATVAPSGRGLDAELLLLESAADVDSSDIDMTVPLRAFAAKMVELVEQAAGDSLMKGGRFREMMIREKATSELRRIESFARDRLGGRGGA